MDLTHKTFFTCRYVDITHLPVGNDLAACVSIEQALRVMYVVCGLISSKVYGKCKCWFFATHF